MSCRVMPICSKELTEILSSLSTGVVSDGGFKGLPEPFVEITDHDYWHLANVGSVRATEYRQICDDAIDKKMREVTIYWFRTFGIAVMRPSKWRCGDSSKGEPSIFYEEPARYFRLGCEHKWVETSNVNMLHKETCSECGAKRSYDSSG